MAPSLDTLPVELIEHITCQLAPTDLCNLRLVCKDVLAKSFSFFAKRHFSAKQFMLSRFSLQALIDISNHKTLAPYMRKIIIGIDHLVDDRGVLPTPGGDTLILGAPPGETEEQNMAFRRHVNDQMMAIYAGLDLAMLTTAIANLRTSCYTLELRDYYSYRPIDRSYWRSYGAWTLFRETGRLPMIALEVVGQKTLHRCFAVMLAAAANSGIGLRSLLVTLRNGRILSRHGLHPEVLYVPDWQRSQLSAMLCGLETLSLAIDAGRDISYRTENPLKRLSSFLSLSSNLRTLRLNFQYKPNSDGVLEELSASAGLPSLQTLEIGFLQSTGDRLVKFTRRFQHSLRSLTLFRVDMGQGKWHSFLIHIKQDLSLSLLKLDCIRTASDHTYNIGFKPMQDAVITSYEDLQKSITCSGSVKEVQNAITELQSKLVVADNKFYKSLRGSDSGSDPSGDDSDMLDEHDSEDEDMYGDDESD